MPAEITCASIAEQMAGVVDGGTELTLGERRHAETCLRCQADLVQYRRVLRALKGMRNELLAPPPGALGQLLAEIEDAASRRAAHSAVQGRTVAYVGGIAAATAAGAAGAILLATRSRRLRPAS